MRRVRTPAWSRHHHHRTDRALSSRCARWCVATDSDSSPTRVCCRCYPPRGGREVHAHCSCRGMMHDVLSIFNYFPFAHGKNVHIHTYSHVCHTHTHTHTHTRARQQTSLFFSCSVPTQNTHFHALWHTSPGCARPPIGAAQPMGGLCHRGPCSRRCCCQRVSLTCGYVKSIFYSSISFILLYNYVSYYS